MFQTYTAKDDDRPKDDDRQRSRIEGLQNKLQQSFQRIQALEYRLKLKTRTNEELKQRNLELFNSCRDLLDDSQNDAKKRKAAERRETEAKKRETKAKKRENKAKKRENKAKKRERAARESAAAARESAAAARESAAAAQLRLDTLTGVAEEEKPDFVNSNCRLTSITLESLNLFLDTVTHIAKLKVRMKLKKFVTTIYFPYFDGKFGQSFAPPIEEIIRECSYEAGDEASNDILCSLNEEMIRHLLLQHAKQEHLDHIAVTFERFKKKTFVSQRTFDMGYHQAKDVLEGLERSNVPFQPRDQAMKTLIFGSGPNECFVSGGEQKGVGDHIYPVRGNRNITACYGGNSLWNIANVKSALNQPYKNTICEVGGVRFVKVCLDNTEFNIHFDEFEELFQQQWPEDRFRDRFQHLFEVKYEEIHTHLHECTTKLRNWYLNSATSVHAQCHIIRNVSDFKLRLIKMCGISYDIDILLQLPKCSTWDSVSGFMESLQNMTEVWEAFVQTCHTGFMKFIDNRQVALQEDDFAKEVLKCLLSKERAKFELTTQGSLINYAATIRSELTSAVTEFVSKHFEGTLLSGGKGTSLKNSVQSIWKFLKMDGPLKKLKDSGAEECLAWMQSKEQNGLYDRSDAVKIYMKLEIWKRYVQSVQRDGKTPKMQWQMSPDDLNEIERMLKEGVNYIDTMTQRFIAKRISERSEGGGKSDE